MIAAGLDRFFIYQSLKNDSMTKILKILNFIDCLIICVRPFEPVTVKK